jgi:hypothetical protein
VKEKKEMDTTTREHTTRAAEPRTHRHVSSSPSLKLHGQDLWIFAYPEMQAMADGVLQALGQDAREVRVEASL